MNNQWKETYQLSDRVVLVTGAAGDIGRVITHHLLDAGCIVIASDVQIGNLSALQTQYQASLYPEVLDITHSASIDLVIKNILSRFGQLDILINAAGILCRKPFFETQKTDFQKTLELNVTAAFDLAQKSASVMKRGSSIINIGSQNGFTAIENRIAYAASKAALTMMTKSMALELAPLGIRVNQVAPGIVDSSMAKVRLNTKSRIQQYESYIPLGRLTPPEAVADSVLFLISPMAASITGTTLLVDDGLLLRQNLPREINTL